MGTVTVARRYRFKALHSIRGGAEPWCFPHEHAYTVEVTVEDDRMSDGMVIDTDRLDAWWATRLPLFERCNLDETLPVARTTVEAIAGYLIDHAAENDLALSAVTVWEDDDRWGRATRP